MVSCSTCQRAEATTKKFNVLAALGLAVVIPGIGFIAYLIHYESKDNDLCAVCAT